MSWSWFTSDLHLRHATVAHSRGFAFPDLHDAYLAAQWDEQVGLLDTVYVLGDLSMGGQENDYMLRWIMDRPGEKVLVLGNHDDGHHMHRRSQRWRHRYVLSGAFREVHRQLALRIRGQLVLLSHFPPLNHPEPDHTATVRYRDWRPKTLPGVAYLHGHTHSSVRVQGNSICVGPEAWGGRLAGEFDIASLLRRMRYIDPVFQLTAPEFHWNIDLNSVQGIEAQAVPGVPAVDPWLRPGPPDFPAPPAQLQRMREAGRTYPAYPPPPVN